LGLGKLEISLGVIDELPNLDTPQVVLARNAGVVVEEQPLALEFDNGMMRRPSLDWFQDSTTVGEWSKGRFASSVT